MMVRVLLFAFVLAALLGCKKDELTFTLTGTISDKTYNSPQNSGTVKVYKVPVVGQGTSNELVGQTKPDAQGKYSITFPREKAEAYVITYTQNSYFDEDFTIPFSAWSTEEDYVLNFTTETISTVRWLIQKTTPSSVNGEVKIYKQSGRTKGEFCCANEAYTYTGFEVNDTLTCASGGGSYVRYQVVNLAEGIFYTDSIYCPPTGIGEAVVNF
jgi:hypothetical protein